MVEDKKRFPWWLVAWAVPLVVLAAAVGFIETVGRQGTIVGRYDQIKKGMTEPEVNRLLDGFTSGGCSEPPITPPGTPVFFHPMWVDGPALVTVTFPLDKDPVADATVFSKELRLDPERYTFWWRARRWAEPAYTAIHGPRR